MRPSGLWSVRRSVSSSATLSSPRSGRADCMVRASVRYQSQLMELPHDGEHLKHPLRGSWRPPPVLTAERDLGDLLPSTEAVVSGATRKAPLPEGLMDTAAEV